MLQKITISVVFLLVVYMTSSLSFAADNSPPPLIIYFVDHNPPYSFKLPDGKPTGFYVEFWQLWAEHNDIETITVLNSMEEGVSLVKQHQGIHSGLFISDERKKWADFSDPIDEVETGILFSQQFSKTTKLASLKNVTAASYESTFQASFLRKRYPNLNLEFYQDSNHVFEHLLNNDIQLLIAELPYLEQQLAKRGLYGVLEISDERLFTNTVHAIVAKGQPQLLKRINNGISNIPISKLIRLNDKWLPNHKSYFKDAVNFEALTLEEKNWLQKHQSFSLGIDLVWYPFEFTDKKGNFTGISADYIDYISEQLKVDFIADTSRTWVGSLEALKTGKIDIITAIVRTSEREKHLSFTQPYFTEPTAIVTRKESFYTGSIENLRNKKLGLIKGFALLEIISKDYPDIIITEVLSVDDGLKKVQSGEIDAFINSISVLNHEIVHSEYNDLFIAATSPYKLEISMAVRKGLEPLIPILNKSFYSMTEKQKSTIANTWLSVHLDSGINIKEILLWTLPILTLLFGVIAIISRINRRLQVEINSRLAAEKERGYLENQLNQSQKMEALGKLTGGIAHDFNNMLGIIIGYSSLLMKPSINNDKQQYYAKEINQAAERGASLTRKLLSFTQKNSTNASAIDINRLLLEQKDMLQKMLTVRINLKFKLENQLWQSWLDQSDLIDALVNISINAMQALNFTNDQATLEITTSNILLNENQAKTLHTPEGEYIILSIADNGIGMDESTKDKIFEPFFSTKGGSGTGLGLSQVFGFTQRSQSIISVSSTLGEGSEFTFYFPRYTNNIADLAD